MKCQFIRYPAAFALLALISGCSMRDDTFKASDRDTVVAKVGPLSVYQSDLVARLRRATAQEREFFLTPAGHKDLLNRLINNKLLVLEARRRDLHNSDQFRLAMRLFQEFRLANTVHKTLDEELFKPTDAEVTAAINAEISSGRAPKDASPEAAQERVRRILIQQKYRSWLAQQRKKTLIQYDESLLAGAIAESAAVLPPPAAPKAAHDKSTR